jgi:hypothetical protein
LFVEPTHIYTGRPFTIEAVLANEDVVRPGEYPARFELWGPNGIAWHRETNVVIPAIKKGEDGPLAVPVLKEEITLQGPEGAYELVPYVERGIASPETSWKFYLTDPASFPKVDAQVATWGIPDTVEAWLRAHGVVSSPLQKVAAEKRELILVGDVSVTASPADWQRLAVRIATGSTVIFFSPQAFKREKEGAAWLPLAKKGRVYEFNDWLYHKECVAKSHPVFEGLQGTGLLDWYFYGPVLPHYVFDGQDTPAEVIAAAFAAGYSTPGGYASGVLLGSYKFGAGQFFVNSFSILENVDKHPTADRLMLNLIQHAVKSTVDAPVPPPPNFQSLLKEIGFAS